MEPKPTGTLAWLNEFVSDTPTDINVIHQRVTVIANFISTMANELHEKLQQTPGPIDPKLEEETLALLEPLNREMELLLAAKRRLESQKR